nr:DUF2892 domain-containing protein [uncultured Sphingomonas sp.]
MKTNVGRFDRGFRVAVAVVIAILLVTHVLTGAAAFFAAIIALILVITSLIGYCPAYAVIGVNSCGKR